MLPLCVIRTNTFKNIKRNEYVSPVPDIYYINVTVPGRKIMHYIYRTDSRHISWLYLFLGGFLIGVFAMNIWRNLFLQDMELLNAASLSRLRYLEVDGGSFFLYVLKERIGTAFLRSE